MNRRQIVWIRAIEIAALTASLLGVAAFALR